MSQQSPNFELRQVYLLFAEPHRPLGDIFDVAVAVAEAVVREADEPGVVLVPVLVLVSPLMVVDVASTMLVLKGWVGSG